MEWAETAWDEEFDRVDSALDRREKTARDAEQRGDTRSSRDWMDSSSVEIDWDGLGRTGKGDRKEDLDREQRNCWGRNKEKDSSRLMDCYGCCCYWGYYLDGNFLDFEEEETAWVKEDWWVKLHLRGE